MTHVPHLSALALAAMTMAAQAAPIPHGHGTAPGSAYNSGAMSGFATTGAMMSGMVVTAYFADSTSDSAIWGTTGAASGGAYGAGWFLTLDGDSFTTPWLLINDARAAMTGFMINGRPGRTVFDMIPDPTLSPGSARGKPFSDVDLGGIGVDSAHALYTDRLFVDAVFYEDLYTVMAVRFAGPGLYGDLTFLADTDNATVDIRPGIPEPQTYLLMALGLVGIGVVARRRQAAR